MKLLIVRHGDPDYDHDTLTEKGRREAGFLAERLTELNVKAFYVSPLGRAKDTAAPTLNALGRAAEEQDWLQEFQAPIQKPNKPGLSIPWDWLPQDWTEEERFFHYDRWLEPEVMQNSSVPSEYRRVTACLDALLARHGYTRKGRRYEARRSNEDTIVLFCHFGVECVILSHLLSISPMQLWHGLCAAPASVTTLATEERRKGIAVFRVLSFGDVSHLTAHGEPPAFAARFCETFDSEERHD